MKFSLPIFFVWVLSSTLSCNTTDENAQTNSEPLALVAPELRARVLEDVPVEDRHFLYDSSLIIAQSSRHRSENRSEAINKYIPQEPPSEAQQFYLVAGSFYEEKEALHLAQMLEAEKLPAAIIPNQNMLRVVVVLQNHEDAARQFMDSLNTKYQSRFSFWFLVP